jgi:PLP dependent protein
VAVVVTPAGGPPASGSAAAVDPEQVVRRLATVRDRIRTAGGDPERVTIVAVTKGFGADAVSAAVAAGVGAVGENYAQELVAKHAAVSAAESRSLDWHFIGPVQRNKVKTLAPLVAVWEAVDRSDVGRAIAGHAPGARVLVQVNTTDEPQKSGCTPDQARALVAALAAMGLEVEGLMTIGPAGPPQLAHAAFGRLADLVGRLGLRECSMGMSGDLEVAIEEGATMVRVGTALFGPRARRPATIG